MSEANSNPLHIYEPLLLGKIFAVAQAVAAKKGIFLRKVCIDGVDQAMSLEVRPDRMNVAVVDNIITELISWG